MSHRPRRPFLFVLLPLFVAPPALGDGAPEDPLRPLAWTVGGTWVAEVKRPDGKPLKVETTFEWASHRKALRYTIVIRTDTGTVPQYEGLYWWDPGAKEIHMLQIDRQGNVTKSVATFAGNTMTQKNQLTRADGTKQEQRVELVRDGDDAFSFKALLQKGGEWAEAARFTYKRVREEKPR